MATSFKLAVAEAFGVFGTPEAARFQEGRLLVLVAGAWHDLGGGWKFPRVRRLCHRLRISLEFPWSGRPLRGRVVLRSYGVTVPP